MEDAGAQRPIRRRLRGAPGAPDGAHAEIRALRDKVRQLEAENAHLREQLEALRAARADRAG